MLIELSKKGAKGGLGLAIAGLLGALTPGCARDAQDENITTGVHVAALVEDGTDVVGMNYTLTPVDCGDGMPTGDPAIEASSPIDPDQKIPGNIDELKNMPLDENSSHLFADLFKVLPAGCYDVLATPITAMETASEDCASANKKKVEVLEGKTTEIFMISQCMGVDPGAIDAIVALNHEPVLEDVVFSDSKFSCGSPTEICISASDPDYDPLEIVLEADGCAVDAVGQPGCFEVTCGQIGKVDMIALVYDQLHDGSLVRIEDWLANEGYPNESHAQLEFHAYIDGIVMYEDGDGDGYGSAPVVICEGDDTDGLVDNADDCNDEEAAINPGADEVCDDQIDNNCNGEIDEECQPVPPEPGTDVVVFNDINPFDDGGMADANNHLMVRNLVNFTSGKIRDAGTRVLMDYGRNAVCLGYCNSSSFDQMRTEITNSGLSITDISSASGNIQTFITADVKAIFLWNPTVAFTVDEINALKDFAAEGGRIVFIGEWDGYYGPTGLAVENAFLADMGAVMTNIGLAVDCGYNTLPGASLRPHQVTTGMTEVTIACASVIVPGPGDYPLFYDSTNTQVLAGVATIDTTHIMSLQSVPAVSITANQSLDPALSEGL